MGSVEAEEGAELGGDAAPVLGAAGGDEYGVVAGQGPHHFSEIRLVEGAGDGAGGAGLGAHHDQGAVGVDPVDQPPHRIERQGAAVGLDEVPRTVGADRAPHAEQRHVARQRRLRGPNAARAEAPQELLLILHRRPLSQNLADRVATPVGLHQVTRVPTPRSVNSSATTLWGIRPSMTCTALTPSARASRIAWALTIMPPLMPLPSRASSSAALICEIKFPSSSRMPATSVRKMRRSAPQAAAISPAARSALML